MTWDRTQLSPVRSHRDGFTLVELLVVLTVMTAVAGMVVMTVSSEMTVDDGAGGYVTAQDVATRATMQELKKALLGEIDRPGYHTHNLGLPSRIAGLFEDIDGVGSYDLATKRGWNGPYLFHSGAFYGAHIETGDNFTAAYGDDEDPAILDAWGKPIILQESGTRDARLVSAGRNGVLEMDPSDAEDDVRGDDLVQFLLASDPVVPNP